MPRQIYRRFALVAMLAAAHAATGVASDAVLFAENWDDGFADARWSAPIEVRESASIPFNGAVDYAYDYSVLGAPPAPGSVGRTTVGVFLETNTVDDGPLDEGEAIGILPLGFTMPADDYLLTADAYLFWNGGNGSTEYATLGVHHQGSDNAPLRFNQNNGDGIAWQLDTDGASSDDLIRFEGPGGETRLGGYEQLPDGSIPGVPTGDADPIGPFNRWVQVGISSYRGVVAFSINGVVIDLIDNTNAAFTAGTILLGQSDPFNSVNTNDGLGNSNGVVFDNVRVERIEPIAGDINRDGSVDLLDLDILGRGCFLPCDADINGDGNVDLLDLDILGQNFGQRIEDRYPIGFLATAIPEPTTGALILLGVVALRRRRE